MSEARLPFSPDPLLLTWTERLEAWLWRHRQAHALLGWALIFFPADGEPDDLGDVLKFMGIVTVCAIAVAVGFATGAIQ